MRAPHRSFVLFGVRGVGKSTWARRTLPGALVLDLLDEELFHDLLTDPGLFGSLARRAAPERWIVVDEVQRIPSLLNEVHRLIEEGRRVALLASTTWKLQAAGVPPLAGLVVRRQMFPLLPDELGADFRMEAVLRHGSIPLVWTAGDREAVLESQVRRYLREEPRTESALRNLPGFVRFLPVAARLHGQKLNVSRISRDAAVARSTVASYLRVLEDTLVAWRLSPDQANPGVRERGRPKLYWVDPGLVRAARRRLGPVGSEERGPLFEGWVLGLLRACREEGPLYDDLRHWAAAGSRVEVDALLLRGRERLAIEVKASGRLHSSQLRGLQAVADLPGIARRILVYLGEHRLVTPGGIEVWPVRDFAAALETGTLWP